MLNSLGNFEISSIQQERKITFCSALFNRDSVFKQDSQILSAALSKQTKRFDDHLHLCSCHQCLGLSALNLCFNENSSQLIAILTSLEAWTGGGMDWRRHGPVTSSMPNPLPLHNQV